MVCEREPFVAHRGSRHRSQLYHPAHCTVVGPFDIPVATAPAIHIRQFAHQLQHALQPLRPRWQQHIGRFAAAAPRNIERLTRHLTRQQIFRSALHEIHEIVFMLTLRERDAGVFRAHHFHHDHVAPHDESIARCAHFRRSGGNRDRIVARHAQKARECAGVTVPRIVFS